MWYNWNDYTNRFSSYIIRIRLTVSTLYLKTCTQLKDVVFERKSESEWCCVLADPQTFKRKLIKPKLHCLPFRYLPNQKMIWQNFGICFVFYLSFFLTSGYLLFSKNCNLSIFPICSPSFAFISLQFPHKNSAGLAFTRNMFAYLCSVYF